MQIEEAVSAIADAQTSLEMFRSTLEGDLRIATVDAFLHSCVYSLVAALHHLVTGYGVGCGHMLRHVYESVAMAALCCDQDSQVFEAFTNDRTGYRVDQAPDKLRRPKVKKRLDTLLSIDADAWASHLDRNLDFQRRSHTTGLTLAFQVMLDSDDMMIIGGEYDSGKDHAYESDLKRIKGLAHDVANLATNCSKALAEAGEQ